MKLVIPSAGTGSRLGSYTKNFNKALVTVGNQPAIIRIINDLVKRFDIKEVVVLTGYQADLLEEVLFHFSEHLNIRVVRVDNFSGMGSSLSHTLLQAKQFLQTDFIFCANDTLCNLPASINDISCNWMAYYKKRTGDLYQPRNYRTIDVNDQSDVTKIYPKDYGTNNIYVGLAYIRDYSIFWKSMENSNSDIGEVIGLSAFEKIKAVEVEEWHDCGMISSLNRAKNLHNKSDIVVLEKQDEAIWFSNDLVVKQHIDKKFIEDRINRLQYLPADLTPEIKNIKSNSFSYKHIKGNVITRSLDKSTLHQLLSLMNEKLWKNRCSDKKRINDLKSKAHVFYRDKTEARVLQYLNENETLDRPTILNGKLSNRVFDILSRINWEDFIDNSSFAWFHGDFHNENILSDGLNYTLIDWRQNFTEQELEFGDVYYDLAKFQHGLLVSHPIVHSGLFSVEYLAEANVRFEIHQSSRLLEVNRLFEDWLVNNCYCRSRVRLLTALIYLNIAVLHDQPYGQLLFFYGRFLLQLEYEDLASPYFLREKFVEAS